MDEVMELINQLILLMKRGRFSLLKWICIAPVALRNISE